MYTLLMVILAFLWRGVKPWLMRGAQGHHGYAREEAQTNCTEVLTLEYTLLQTSAQKGR